MAISNKTFNNMIFTIFMRYPFLIFHCAKAPIFLLLILSINERFVASDIYFLFGRRLNIQSHSAFKRT